MYKLTLDETPIPLRKQIKLGNITTRETLTQYLKFTATLGDERRLLTYETSRFNYGRGF
jgi:hypothetical protein